MHSKELALGTLTVIAPVANAYLWKGVLADGSIHNPTFYSIPVGMLLIFSILFALSALFIRERWTRIGTSVLAGSAGYLLIPFTATVGIAAVLSGLISWVAARDIMNDETASQVFSVRKTLRSGMPLFFTSLALLLTVFYYSSISDRNNQDVLPKPLFDSVVPLLQAPLQSILPGFTADITIDQLLFAIAAKQFGENFDAANLSVSEKAQILQQGHQALEQQFGVSMKGSEKASDVLYRATNAQIDNFVGSYRLYLPIVTAIGFFLTIKVLTQPVYWLTLLLVFVVIKSLKALDVVRLETETLQVQRLRL